MTREDALRAFLTSRRAAIGPEGVGLPAAGDTRRVPGLRREEVAALAGISAAYYKKLEQGRAGHVSGQVISAVARALRLNALERAHLTALLREQRHSPDVGTPAGTVKARPSVASMVHAMDPLPAVVHGPRLEVLALNRTAALLIDDFESMPLRSRNLARWTFLNPRAKQVYADWPTVAPQVAAGLRHIAANRVRDRILERLIGEITIASPEFAQFWSEYDLYEHGHGIKTFRNDLVGTLTLEYETLALSDAEDQSLIVYTPQRGSADEEKLHIMASWGRSRHGAGHKPQRDTH
ncbi:helix-turn-helix transcriptional regulator [Streptomyces sp. Inha503]|uniref:helix-turn-helix transcriptional regulator n=1 Tax=Streptomyces sp. Inha503 TaxID=3383314 RepID=UPI00399F04A9